MLSIVAVVVAVYEWKKAGCCPLLQYMGQISGRVLVVGMSGMWLVIAVVVVSCCSGCCRLLQWFVVARMSQISGRWLVVAVVVVSCCRL